MIIVIIIIITFLTPVLNSEGMKNYYYYCYYLLAAGRKTRLDIQNYGCNGNLLCYHGVVKRNRISSLQSHGKALLRALRLMSSGCLP